jgi:hypothetical protein
MWQACDWIARYLEGGAKVFVFHTVDLERCALVQTICSDRTVASVRAHLLATWQALGLPHRLHLMMPPLTDNIIGEAMRA